MSFFLSVIGLIYLILVVLWMLWIHKHKFAKGTCSSWNIWWIQFLGLCITRESSPIAGYLALQINTLWVKGQSLCLSLFFCDCFRATFMYEQFPEVMNMLWARMLRDNKKNWRRVYKVCHSTVAISNKHICLFMKALALSYSFDLL